MHLIASRGEVEAVVDEACQHIYEIMMELDPTAKSKRLGEAIIQLYLTNNLFNAMVYPDMLLEQVVEWKNAIEAIATWFEAME